jgi:hypothetical protein
MLRLYRISFILILSTVLTAQEIPNHSFEDWDQGIPISWWGTAILQVSDAFDGNSAVSMQVLDNGVGGVIIPFLTSGDFANGFPISQRYGSFNGYYKFNPNGNEWFNVGILMMFNTNAIGGGAGQFSATSPSTWTEFNVPIVYSTEDIPDLAIITISVVNDSETGVIGSNAIVDYVMFGAPTKVDQISGLPEEYSLKQNYPNPFNPTTSIEYSIPKASFVQLKVYDIIGNEIAVLVRGDQAAGVYRTDFNAASLPSGMYFAMLTTNEFVQIVKMTLLK